MMAIRSKFGFKTFLKIIIPILIIVILLGGIFLIFGQKPDNAATPPSTPGVLNDNVKTVNIGRTFEFPLKNDKGDSLGTFKYIIQTAELRHNIVVKGQNASSVPGRVFLVINVKIVNTLNQGLSINTRDYIRISVNNNQKDWFAPNIHSDPVDAQAISTTDARLALAISETDKNIKLQVGEIAGKKEIIPVSFNN